MSQNEFKSILRAVIITVVSSLIISFGGFLASWYGTKNQVRANTFELRKKADKEFVLNEVDKAKQIAEEKEKRVNESILKLNDDVKELKDGQKTTNSLLWDIRNKIKD